MQDAVALSERELEEAIRLMCESKADEFRLLGYESITAEDVWECVRERYRTDGLPRLYRLASDILSLKPTEWMNWATLKALRP
ncbi:MAG: hypothetical protein BLM47_08330 [Candidatus Reconcilbacillus cellulovorans]|uniref:Post-transcriptional regulator n=1 Tax=Candidatus Reconcilbacillus cellulovorans TaxID=1906605 RepID=A0A2A6E0G5_9BACL|nr:MAG: hypothetical protein BLM47_08330 [Candidatus Reconcilbacillus cellulovorans]